jgi:translocation and assembly module TamB
MPRLRTVSIIAAAVVVTVLACVGATMYWLATSEGALHWAIARLEAASSGRLRIESASGTLLGPVETVRITYADAERTVQVERARIEINRGLLLQGMLEVQSLRIDTVYVTSKQDRDEPPSPPQDLSLPLEVRVRRLDIGRVVVAQGTETITLAQIAGSYEGGAARHRLRVEPMQTPWGTAGGDVALGARTPFELNGALKVLARALDRPLELDGTLNGTLLAPRAVLDARIGETRAHGEAELAPFTPDWLREVRIEARSVDLAAFIEGAPRSDARIAVRASGGASGALRGRAEIANANPGALSAERLPLASLETQFAFERGTLKLDALQASLGGAGRAHGSGEIEGARMRLSLAVEALDLRGIHADIRRTRLAGSLQVEAGETAQRVTLDLADAGLKVSAGLRREGERLVAETLRAVAFGGEVSGTGSLELGGKRAFTAQLKARGFDPARFGEFPRALLNGTIDARGTLAPAWRAQVQATLASSRFRGAPLEARARFEAAPGLVRALDADVRIGDNRVQASGGFGAPGQALDVAIHARRLAQLDPRAAGSLSGKARLEGSPRRFGGTFELEGANLAFEGQGRTLKLRASGSVPLDARKDFSVDLRATGIDMTQAKLESTRIRLSGRLDAHDIVGEAKSPGFDAQFAANGGWSG